MLVIPLVNDGSVKEYGFYKEAYDNKTLQRICQSYTNGKCIACVCLLGIQQRNCLRGDFLQRKLSTMEEHDVDEVIVVNSNAVDEFSYWIGKDGWTS